MKKIIFGVKIPSQSSCIPEFQKTLLKYGGLIKTRLGLHNANESVDAPFGIVLLEMSGNDAEISSFEAEILKHEDIEIQKMYFRM
ncbi:MAG: hypothetical protein JXR53_05385 [Bacteroidales bacterium]|jgi:hypothetical protein|nr:hypothetical protein [Bacteroidales bacterium]